MTLVQVVEVLEDTGLLSALLAVELRKSHL
jgi:hypothetical protein